MNDISISSELFRNKTLQKKKEITSQFDDHSGMKSRSRVNLSRLTLHN